MAAFTTVFGFAGIIYSLIGLSLGGTLFYLLIGVVTIVMLVFFTRYSISRHFQAKLVFDGELPRLERIVDDMSIRFSLPRPRLMLIQSDEPNAFTFGFGKHTYVGVSCGLLSALNDDELKAVIAHEFAHIWSRDSITQTLGIAVKKTLFAFTALLAVIIVIAGMMISALLLSLSGLKPKSLKEGLMVVPLAMSLAAYLLSPIIIGACYCIFSRKAEFRADACSAKMTGRPEDLALALMRIDQYPRQSLAARNHGIYSSLWIASKGDKSLLDKIMSTHPPVNERVWRLIEMVPLRTSGQTLREKSSASSKHSNKEDSR